MAYWAPMPAQARRQTDIRSDAQREAAWGLGYAQAEWKLYSAAASSSAAASGAASAAAAAAGASPFLGAVFQ